MACECGSLEHATGSPECLAMPKCHLCGMSEEWHLRSGKRHKFTTKEVSPKLSALST